MKRRASSSGSASEWALCTPRRPDGLKTALSAKQRHRFSLWLIIDAEGIGALDASAIDMLGDLLARMTSEGLAVIGIARANDRVIERLGRAGRLEPEGHLRNFATINAAVNAFHQRES